MAHTFLDPAPITRHLRAKAGSWLLVAAVHHFDLFELLDNGQMSPEQLQKSLQIAPRPAKVLFPALCAMELMRYNRLGNYELTDLGRLLVKSNPNHLTGYTGLERDEPGVLKMVEWLQHDGPKSGVQGFAYVKDERTESPMDDPEAATFFTMALAGRAKYLSPIVADKMSRRNGHLLDVAGGTGYYSYEWLLFNPSSTATIIDTPEVLKVAKGILDNFKRRDEIMSRVNFVSGDMLKDDLPKADIILAASLFHDWPEETCLHLANRFAKALHTGGEIWMHDAFLHDSLDGPLPVTDYSAMLFLGTKGRCYSRQEYYSWLVSAGLKPTDKNIPTLMDYSLISAVKPLK